MLIMSVVIRNIKSQLLMNVCSFNVRLYSCKSPLLTIGSIGVLNSYNRIVQDALGHHSSSGSTGIFLFSRRSTPVKQIPSSL